MTLATQLLPLSLVHTPSLSPSVCLYLSLSLSLGALNMQITSFLIKITVHCFWFLALALARFENTFLADFVWLLALHTHTHPLCRVALGFSFGIY